MKIRLASADTEADYIRKVRVATLEGLGINPTASMIEPIRCATYVIAYDASSRRPLGMAESAMFRDAYDRYDESPYSTICDLNSFCPVEEMAGIRTIYVEPEFRSASGIFMALALASAKLAHDQGARYATANTHGSASDLKRLYCKTGGEYIGHTDLDGLDISLFLFELKRALNHRVYRRVSQHFDFSLDSETMAIAESHSL